MAKLTAPLFSLGASQQLGKALVYFSWKGLNVVRSYVTPANPRSAGQVTQRGYLTAAVAGIHAAQSDATHPLTDADKSAYALLGSLTKAAQTWFNTACRQWVNQLVAALTGIAYTGGATTPGAGQLAVQLYAPTNAPTAGTFYYGTSKSALLGSIAATVAGVSLSATITTLTAGTKYYWQFKGTAPAGAIGANSGIYTGTPT